MVPDFRPVCILFKIDQGSIARADWSGAHAERAQMTDYKALIDAETWSFIHATDGFYPPDAAAQGVAHNRAVYDAMCRAFHADHPEGVTTENRAFAGVACRIYETSTARSGTVVYFHGGGGVVGGLDSHDDICAEICARTGLRVVSVDYRLAPEHRHPAAYDDACTATDAVAAGYEGPLVLVGDSAGATLAASVCHARRDRLAIAGQILIYPFLGAAAGTGSRVDHAFAPLLRADELEYYTAVRHPGDVVPAPDPSFEPLCDDNMAGLPPTITFAAECDPLADDARIYAARLTDVGVSAFCVEEPGLVHGYLRARGSVARARASFDRIVDGVATLAGGDWPKWA